MINKFLGKRAAFSIALCFCFALAPNLTVGQLDSLNNRRNEVTDCEANLAIATAEFNAGRFFSLPSILQDCLNKGFTREQQVRAYILLCQVYLINDNPAEAEASYIKLLHADPEYVATPELDPIDVVYLSQKFTTRPVFTPNIKAGIGTSFTSLIHDQFPANDSIHSVNALQLGWTIGGGIDWNMSDRLSTSLDVLVCSRSVQKTIPNIFDGDILISKANLTWIDVPVFIKYQDQLGKWRPFAYAGYGFHFRISSKYQLTYTNFELSTGTSTPTEGTDVDFSDRQNFFNRSLVLGGGIKYKIGKNFLFADLRANIGLSNVTNINSNTSFENGDAARFSFINDYYRVNSIQVLVGYIIPYYNPRKKGGWEPKGFLGKILYGNKSITK